MQKVFVAGHPLAYSRSGSGEPVLLVHGFATHSFIWHDVVPRLAERYDVIAVDLLGCGVSAQPGGVSYSLASQAEYLAELVQWLGVRPVHFVGHEVGGGIGQILAARHPKTLRSLTLVNSVAHDLWPAWPVRALRIPFVGQLVLSLLDAGFITWQTRRSLVHKEKATPAVLTAIATPIQTLIGRQALAHFARCLDVGDLTVLEPELKKLACPVTVVWGTADAWLPAATPDRLLAAIPGAALRRIEGAGHLVPVDEPEKLAAVLLEALGAA